MKKFIAIMISVMMFVSLFAGLQISAEASETDPVWIWDLGTAEGKNAGQFDGTKNNVTSSEDWATVTDNDGDGMIYPAGGATAMGSFAAADAKYMVVKLRVTTGYETAHRAEFISHNGTGHGTVAADVAATEGWQYASASTEGVGNWSGTINWVRIDPVNCAGCVADVDWVAFFADEASAEAFVDADKAADAPVEEVSVRKSIDRFNGVATPIADCTYIQGQASDITILGWIITDQGISNVKYSIDGGEAIELNPTRERPDVLGAIGYAGPELANADKVGIGTDAEHAKIDISGLAVGEHEVKLYVYTNDGTEVEFASFKVTILAPLAEGEIINLSDITEPGEYKLVADVTGNLNLSSGDYVIDLNGHTWTNSGIALNVTGANVTIIDSVGDGYIMATANDCIDIGAGSLTVTEATAIATADGMDAIFVGGGTVVTNDATLYGGKSGINASATGVDITVNGGVFAGVYSGDAFARTAAFEFRNNATVKLNGQIMFGVNTIIRRANHTISWAETFITEEGYEIEFAEADTDIGVHGGNPYYSNTVSYDAVVEEDVNISKSIDRFNGVATPIADCTYIQGQASDITILGWIITDKGLSNVKYSIDGGEAIELNPTRPRPDVLGAIGYAGPELANADKVGIGTDAEHAKIDISGLAVGEHEVKLYVYTNLGTEIEFASFKVTILAPLAEGEVADLNGINAPGEYKLAADVTGNLNLSSGDYVIDLNGHTWTNSGIALNVTGANVTIIDSVGGGYIMATANDCIDISAGSLTVTNATAIATADGMDAIFVGGGKVVTNNATLYGGKSGINAANTGVDITVNGGTFGGVYSGEYFARTAAFELRNNATVKLNGDIIFECPTIIRRANHTNYWEDTFILGEGATAFYDFDDVDIGVHGGNQYYSNYIYYSYSVPAVVGLTPHSGHYGSPILWLQSPDHFYEMIINAQGDFNAIISSVWASNDGTTCTLDIYAWNSDRETTLAGEPIVSLTESFTGNPSNYVFDLGDTLWSGQYIVVVRCTEGYLVLPVADETANGAEIAVNTVNSQNVTGKYWVASVNFVDENYATFGELLEDAGSSEENPYFIWDITGTATVKPGATYYVAGYWGGMGIEVTGEGDFVVVYNATTLNPENGVVSFTAEPGMGRMPVIFAIVNNTNAAAEYSIVATHPTGSYMNPEEYDPAEETTNTVDLPEGSFDGYYFSFIATEDGSITLYIDSITDGAEGDIIITATDAEYMSVMKSLSEDGVDGKVTINYKAGDEVIINVFAQADDNWNIPAATITIGQYVESSDTGDFGLIALAFVAISSVVLKKKKEY